MSQVDYNQIIPSLSILDTTAYIELAATALFCYDYLLTFSQEVKCIWGRKFSGASLLFLINRYVVLVNRFVRLIQFISWRGYTESQADSVCNAVWRVSEVCTILMYIAIAGFSALRMYAIYNRSRRILVIVLIMGIVNPCVNIYYNTTLTFQAMPPPFRGCGQQSSLNSPADLVFFVFGAAFSILFEAVVLALTWSRTADIMIILRRMKMKMGITELLWRDGTIYFMVLLVLTCLSLLSIRDSMFNNIPALTDTLSSICLSRFMLNLRAISLSSGNRVSSNTSISDLKFVSSSLVGNLGAPLSVPVRKEEDDDEDFLDMETDSMVDTIEIHQISDDPLMIGIVADMD